MRESVLMQVGVQSGPRMVKELLIEMTTAFAYMMFSPVNQPFGLINTITNIVTSSRILLGHPMVSGWHCLLNGIKVLN